MSQTATIGTAAASEGHASGAEGAAIAASRALAGLGTEPALLLAFPSGIDPRRAACEIRDAAPGVPVAGMTASGAICSDGPIGTGCAALAFASGTPVGIGVRDDAGVDLRGAARGAAADAARAARARGASALTLLLFVDSRCGDQAEAVAGAYAAVGPTVPILGGGAGGDEPAQLAGGTARRNAVVAVALGGRRRAGVGVAHGARSFPIPSIATRSSGRKLLELDGRPAATVYLERLGCADRDLDDEEFRSLAVTHPLAQPELSGDSRLRHVLSRTPEGALECATHIPVSSAIGFTHQDVADMHESAVRAVRDARSRIARQVPSAALVFDCAGRKSALAGAVEQEVDALVGAFGDQAPPMAGGFSHGEIARVRGAKGDRNHAVVVAAFD